MFFNAQPLDSLLYQVKSNIELDSLVKHVRILSGEDSVRIDNKMVLIANRNSNEKKQLAAEYIFVELRNFGYEPYYQVYPTGKNILAIKYGIEDTTMNIILCAHYDSVTDFCADDNASGVSAVLEAARNLREFETRFNIIFALWDEEERNLRGSTYFVENSQIKNTEVNAVINLDMIGWDENYDGKFDVAVFEKSNSYEQLSVINKIVDNVELNLTPNIVFPGGLLSDHYSFSRRDFGSMLIIENYFGDDFNDYYHSPNDRIEHFNLEYFFNMSTLAALTTFYCANSRIVDITELNMLNEGGFDNQDEFIINCKLNNTESTAYKVFAIIDSIDSNNLDTLDLYDDGVHYDKIAGDNIWGNKWISSEIEGYYFAEIITHDIYEGINFNHPERKFFTTVGPVAIDSFWADINFEDTLTIRMWLKNHGNTQNTHQLRYVLVALDTTINYNTPFFGNVQEIEPGTTIEVFPPIKVKINRRKYNEMDFTLDLYDSYFSDSYGSIIFWQDSIMNYFVTSIEESITLQPVTLRLEQNYPNPFNPSTKIKYSIPNNVSNLSSGESVIVSLKIFDITGRELKTLIREEHIPGNYEITFDAFDLASGVYFYQLKAGELNLTKKMLLIR